MRFILIGICLVILLSCTNIQETMVKVPGNVDTDNDG
jgi:hypothetical protein